MRNKAGIFCMLLGAVLVLGALFLFIRNEDESDDAGAFSQDVMPELQDEILQALQTAPTTLDDSENTPVELLRPEDVVMTEKYIKGYPYIGYLTIPDLELELPVMSNWDSKRLTISPCRFMGTVKGEDIVIMAHNYKSHFGRLNTLKTGSKILFTDMDGNVFTYEVVAFEVLQPNQVEDLCITDWDLTLFTCTIGGRTRFVVRCEKLKTPY